MVPVVRRGSSTNESHEQTHQPTQTNAYSQLPPARNACSQLQPACKVIHGSLGHQVYELGFLDFGGKLFCTFLATRLLLHGCLLHPLHLLQLLHRQLLHLHLLQLLNLLHLLHRHLPILHGLHRSHHHWHHQRHRDDGLTACAAQEAHKKLSTDNQNVHSAISKERGERNPAKQTCRILKATRLCAGWGIGRSAWRTGYSAWRIGRSAWHDTAVGVFFQCLEAVHSPPKLLQAHKSGSAAHHKKQRTTCLPPHPQRGPPHFSSQLSMAPNFLCSRCRTRRFSARLGASALASQDLGSTGFASQHRKLTRPSCRYANL